MNTFQIYDNFIETAKSQQYRPVWYSLNQPWKQNHRDWYAQFVAIKELLISETYSLENEDSILQTADGENDGKFWK